MNVPFGFSFNSCDLWCRTVIEILLEAFNGSWFFYREQVIKIYKMCFYDSRLEIQHQWAMLGTAVNTTQYWLLKSFPNTSEAHFLDTAVSWVSLRSLQPAGSYHLGNLTIYSFDYLGSITNWWDINMNILLYSSCRSNSGHRDVNTVHN